MTRPLMNYSPDRSEGAVRDKGISRGFVGSLGELCLRVNDEDAIYKLQSTRSGPLLVSYYSSYRAISSTRERTNDELRDSPGRIKDTGSIGNKEKGARMRLKPLSSTVKQCCAASGY